MRLACPACQAIYEVPEALVRPGVALRCARCANDWVPVAAPPPQAALPAPPEVPQLAAPDAPSETFEDVPAAPQRPAPAPFPRLRATRPEPPDIDVITPDPDPPSRTPVLVGWALSVAILAGAGWAAVEWRQTVMEAWPPSARAYAALGLR